MGTLGDVTGGSLGCHGAQGVSGGCQDSKPPTQMSSVWGWVRAVPRGSACVCVCVSLRVYACMYTPMRVCVCAHLYISVFVAAHTCVEVHSDVQQVQCVAEPVQGLPQPHVGLLHLGEAAPGAQVASRGITGTGPGHPTPPPQAYCLAPEDEDDPVVKDGQRHEADPSVVPVPGGVQGPVPGGGSVAGGHRGTWGHSIPIWDPSAPRSPPAASGSKAQPAPPAPVGVRGSPLCPYPQPHGRQPCPAHPVACPVPVLVPVPALAAVAMGPEVLQGWSRAWRQDRREPRVCILHSGDPVRPDSRGPVHLSAWQVLPPAPVPSVVPQGEPATGLLQHGRVLATWGPQRTHWSPGVAGLR